MAAVNPAGPVPTMTTLRRSAIGVRGDAALGVGEEPAQAEEGAEGQVGDPHGSGRGSPWSGG